MGLDMYLNARRFLWHTEDDISKKISENFPEIGNKRVKEITAEAGYWRKANAIHKWFVDNVQEGTDDCGTYEVTTDKLKELLDVIEQVLADKNKAGKLLPTQGGFFFGQTDYDEYYIDELQYTKEIITDILKGDWKGWYFEYHSSW